MSDTYYYTTENAHVKYSIMVLMAKLKTVIIQDREFVSTKRECKCCEHTFKVVLTMEAFVMWDGMCSQCSSVMPDYLPPKRHFVVERRWG